MTYEEFKAYCMTHLWKVGDSVVIDALDTIIATAEAELNRTFKVEDRVDVVPLIATSPTVSLPADYRELRHLYSTSRGELKYNIPADFSNKLACGRTSWRDFTVVNRDILLAWDTMSLPAPEDLQCWYYKAVPSFKTTEPHWLVEDYFDVYLYCVLKHTAPFLREDERLQTWSSLFGEAFGSAMNENADRKYAGSPLKMKFSRSIR